MTAAAHSALGCSISRDPYQPYMFLVILRRIRVFPFTSAWAESEVEEVSTSVEVLLMVVRMGLGKLFVKVLGMNNPHSLCSCSCPLALLHPGLWSAHCGSDPTPCNEIQQWTSSPSISDMHHHFANATIFNMVGNTFQTFLFPVSCVHRALWNP